MAEGAEMTMEGDLDGGHAMMTLEQIGALAMLWHEAGSDWERRIRAGEPSLKADRLAARRLKSLRRACRDYKLLQKAKGK